jgi:acetoin utilization deacetylase AcuC-like enzyme
MALRAAVASMRIRRLLLIVSRGEVWRRCGYRRRDAVLRDKFDNAFAVVRPPGHPCYALNRAMGFWLFNSVAIAARYAQREYSLQRVAILDWDVHHGNGTQGHFLR